MKSLPAILIVLCITCSTGFAASKTAPAATPESAPQAATATPVSTPPPATPAPAPAAPAPAPAPTLKLEDFILDLATTAQLTDTEKKEVEDNYLSDGPKLLAILNNDALSPLQKAQQVADIRLARNVRIESILIDTDKRHAFVIIEAKYRVALTDLAANGGWSAAAPAPAK